MVLNSVYGAGAGGSGGGGGDDARMRGFGLVTGASSTVVGSTSATVDGSARGDFAFGDAASVRGIATTDRVRGSSLFDGRSGVSLT